MKTSKPSAFFHGPAGSLPPLLPAAVPLSRLVEATRGDACGWLFWPYRDTPSSLDSSRRSGFYLPEGGLKEWGRVFARMAPEVTGAIPARDPGTVEQPVDLLELATNPEAVKAFRRRYLAAFGRGVTVNFPLRGA